MKYLLMIYGDSRMQVRFARADTFRAQRRLPDTQPLEAPAAARTVRVREGHTSVVDGPFSKTGGCLAGSALIEAANVDDAALIASSFPWARTGAIEIRRVRDIKLARQRVGA